MQSRSILIFGLFIFSMLACLDEIDVALPHDASGRLVIEGVAEQSRDFYRFLVTVSRTRTLSNQVFTIDNSAAITLLLNEAEIFSLPNGREFLIEKQEFEGIYGNTADPYLFNIRVETADGNIYESKPQSILVPPASGSISYELDERTELNELENLVDRSYIKIKVNTPVINPEGRRVSMVWSATGVYAFVEGECTTDPYGSPRRCYVTENFGRSIPHVLQGNEINGDYVEGFEILETTASPQFTVGYYLTLVRKTISLESGKYWDQVRQSQQREGTIFDSPVGAIASNIRQLNGDPSAVLGYFYTAGIDTLRQFGTREDGGSLILPCAARPGSFGCCDCRELPFSTTEKPPFWE